MTDREFYQREGEPDGLRNAVWSDQKKQGATGITTVAPYIAGQWGRGE
jgi:hypothetical protein